MDFPNKLVTTSVLLLSLMLLLEGIPPVAAQPLFNSRICQDTFGNYTSTSTFNKNLKELFSTITSNTNIDYGFYNFSTGNGLDRVNGIGLCRPDLTASDCHQCLQNGADEIVVQCPTQKDAVGWYDECMIRYSDRYIFGKLEFGPWYHQDYELFGVSNTSFNASATTLLAKLQKEAASGDSRYKFAAGEATVGNSQKKLYALVQCTPDLEEYDCYYCLDNAIAFSLSNFPGRQARVFFLSCNIRYELYMFYNSTNLKALQLHPSPSPPPSVSSTATKVLRHKKSHTVIKIIVPLIASLALFATVFACCYFKGGRRIKTWRNVENGAELKGRESLQMDFAAIRAATDHFSDDNKLGRGGFGTVYKGILPTGQAIAVKRLSLNSGQGEEEFRNEALLVARLQHRNLVRFLGFCLEDKERLLIYELLPNKSLDSFLYDPTKRAHLDWQTRYKIIVGIARGLLYLHEDSRLLVVHRDLKPSNILLDAAMNPKIADFGMAKLFGADQTKADASKICGTYGYMPPEYVLHGQFSIKSDVFSFGVLLLEIISGRSISSFEKSENGDSLLCFAWKTWLEGTPISMVDPFMPTFNTTEVLRCINIGLLCVQDETSHRPNMSTVVLMLNNYTIVPPVPSRPAFLLYGDMELAQLQSSSSQDVSLGVDESMYEISVSELDPR